MARSEPELEVGQPVLIVSHNHRGTVREPATVTKVGWTLYHVLPDRYEGQEDRWHRVEKFSIETRRSTSAGGSVGYGVWLTTPAEVEMQERREAALKRLRDHQLGFGAGGG